MTQSPPCPTSEPNLGRDDWRKAALTCLIDHGIEGVKITRLAQTLEVSRGSFYWHFKDRADLLDELLAIWRNSNTANLIAAAQHRDGLSAAVLATFECWLDPALYDPRLDLAIRAWARHAPELAIEMRAADQARLAALAQMYETAGQSPAMAEVSARNLYYMQMGYIALDVQESLAQRLGYLEAYYQSYVGQPLDPAMAQNFRAKMQARLGKERAAL